MLGEQPVETLVFDTSPLTHFARQNWLGVLKAVVGQRKAPIPDVVVDEDDNVRVLEWEAAVVTFAEATQGPCFDGLSWQRLHLDGEVQIQGAGEGLGEGDRPSWIGAFSWGQGLSLATFDRDVTRSRSDSRSLASIARCAGPSHPPLRARPSSAGNGSCADSTRPSTSPLLPAPTSCASRGHRASAKQHCWITSSSPWKRRNWQRYSALVATIAN